MKEIKRISKINAVTYKYNEFEKPVQSGLVVTPQMALDMSRQGIPISQHNAPIDMFDDGVPNPGDFVTSDRRRGADLNDMWNEMQDVKLKFQNVVGEYRKKTKNERSL